MKAEKLKNLQDELIQCYQKALIKFKDVVILKTPSIERKLNNRNIGKFLTLMHNDMSSYTKYTERLFRFRDLLLRERQLCRKSQVGTDDMFEEFISLRTMLITFVQRYLVDICHKDIGRCAVCGSDSIITIYGDGYWLKETTFECGTCIKKERSYVSGMGDDVTYLIKCDNDSEMANGL